MQTRKVFFLGNNGPLIYLNANPDLQVMLDKVSQAGGKVLFRKGQNSEQFGFMAVIEDRKGNRIALHSG